MTGHQKTENVKKAATAAAAEEAEARAASLDAEVCDFRRTEHSRNIRNAPEAIKYVRTQRTLKS